MTTVNIHEAKTHFSRFVAEVEGGAEVIIARAGKPVVKLVAIDPPARTDRRFGMLDGQAPELLAIFDNWTEADQAELEALFYDGPFFPPEA